MKGGVYVWRTRKPAAAYNIPIVSRHFGYVGQTSSFWHRDQQHLGQGVYAGKPWADLDPVVYHFALPDWKWLRLALEALLIWSLFPVYNVLLNKHNPRRIKPTAAYRQRAVRDRGRRPLNIRPVHLYLWLLALAGVAWLLHKGGAW
jgi:hypothetical protein